MRVVPPDRAVGDPEGPRRLETEPLVEARVAQQEDHWPAGSFGTSDQLGHQRRADPLALARGCHAKRRHRNASGALQVTDRTKGVSDNGAVIDRDQVEVVRAGSKRPGPRHYVDLGLAVPSLSAESSPHDGEDSLPVVGTRRPYPPAHVGLGLQVARRLASQLPERT